MEVRACHHLGDTTSPPLPCLQTHATATLLSLMLLSCGEARVDLAFSEGYEAGYLDAHQQVAAASWVKYPASPETQASLGVLEYEIKANVVGILSASRGLDASGRTIVEIDITPPKGDLRWVNLRRYESSDGERRLVKELQLNIQAASPVVAPSTDADERWVAQVLADVLRSTLPAADVYQRKTIVTHSWQEYERCLACSKQASDNFGLCVTGCVISLGPACFIGCLAKQAVESTKCPSCGYHDDADWPTPNQRCCEWEGMPGKSRCTYKIPPKGACP